MECATEERFAYTANDESQEDTRENHPQSVHDFEDRFGLVDSGDLECDPQAVVRSLVLSRSHIASVVEKCLKQDYLWQCMASSEIVAVSAQIFSAAVFRITYVQCSRARSDPMFLLHSGGRIYRYFTRSFFAAMALGIPLFGRMLYARLSKVLCL